MKKYLIAFMLALPLGMTAQDNTWERVETEPVQKENRDAKYLVKDAVPEIDGKVCFHQTIEAPGKTADQIYNILLNQLEKMVNEPNQIENSIVALADAEKHELAAAFHEWLVFKDAALALDRTKFNFQIIAKCEDGKADVKLTRISYDYDTNRKPVHYVAEEWITDKYAVNKKHTKLYPISGKFRRKTIDRANFIFNKFSTLLNEK